MVDMTFKIQDLINHHSQLQLLGHTWMWLLNLQMRQSSVCCFSFFIEIVMLTCTRCRGNLFNFSNLRQTVKIRFCFRQGYINTGLHSVVVRTSDCGLESLGSNPIRVLWDF